MSAESVAVAQPPAERFLLCSRNWWSPPISLAMTFRQRLRGLRAVPGGDALLLPTAAVHGHGLRASVGVAGLSETGVVVARRTLAPGQFLRLAGARWALELPARWPLPPPGAALQAHRIS